MALINFTQVEPQAEITSSGINTPLKTIYDDYNGNIDSNNLAANAVTTAKITDANVTTAKIADSAITAAKTSFGGNYSADEVNTGFTWVDSSPIYKKTVSFGTLPNATTASVNHDISNLGHFVSVSGIAWTKGNTALPIPFVNDANSTAGQISILLNSTSIVIETQSDRTVLTSCYITLYYTKTA